MSDSDRFRAQEIQYVLDSLYPSPVPVPLNSKDNFTFLCAVILSAQTTDGKVNEVTKELFARAGTPESLANADVKVIQSIIQPVGLAPQKASNLVKMAQRLVSEFDSKVPGTYEELESLAGVGHKTASVIMSQCFGEPAIAVDTHVHRLALRWRLSKHESNVAYVQRDLYNIFPRENWNKISLQLIYFGREYCTAKNHTNIGCPMCSWIHDKSKSPPRDFSNYQPHKKTKGIVYYSDRQTELHASPELSTFSPSEPPVLSKTIVAAEPELSPSISVNLNMNEDKITIRKGKRIESSRMSGIKRSTSSPIEVTSNLSPVARMKPTESSRVLKKRR